MHQSYVNSSSNINELIEDFIGYEYTDSYGDGKVNSVTISDKIFENESEAIDYVTKTSYWGGEGTAYLVTTCSNKKKLSKGFRKAFDNYKEKRKDLVTFDKNLTIGYGRKSEKVTCPHCGSSISLSFGGRYKECPVCHSTKIISDSNWKTLENKEKLAKKAAEALQAEANKIGATFVCGIEWHC